MNGKRSCWMMLIVSCETFICLAKGTESTFLARFTLLRGVAWVGVSWRVINFAGDPGTFFESSKYPS